MTSSPRLAMLLMATFTLAWVALEEAIGANLQRAYPLMQVVWCRYAVHLVILALVFGWHDPGLLWRTRRPLVQVARSLLMLVMPLSFVLSLQAGLPGGTVWAVFWISPLLILLLASRLLRENVPTSWWAACALGSLGAAGMMASLALPPVLTLALPILMAVSFSTYVVMTRMLRDEALSTNLFYTAAGVFVALTPFVPVIWVMPTAHDAILLGLIGAVGLIALLVLDRSAATAPVSQAAPVLYLHLPALVLFGWWVEGDMPSRRGVAGMVLITGVLVYVWKHRSVAGCQPKVQLQGRASQ